MLRKIVIPYLALFGLLHLIDLAWFLIFREDRTSYEHPIWQFINPAIFFLMYKAIDSYNKWLDSKKIGM